MNFNYWQLFILSILIGFPASMFLALLFSFFAMELNMLETKTLIPRTLIAWLVVVPFLIGIKLAFDWSQLQ